MANLFPETVFFTEPAGVNVGLVPDSLNVPSLTVNDLTINNNINGHPAANIVYTDTPQTITGDKTFTGTTAFNNTVSYSNQMYIYAQFTGITISNSTINLITFTPDSDTSYLIQVYINATSKSTQASYVNKHCIKINNNEVITIGNMFDNFSDVDPALGGFPTLAWANAFPDVQMRATGITGNDLNWDATMFLFPLAYLP